MTRNKDGERKSDDELYPSRMLDKVVVRLPEGMRDLLKRAAAKSGRSVNSEIVSRLAESLILTSAHKKSPALRIVSLANEIHAIAQELDVDDEIKKFYEQQRRRGLDGSNEGKS